MIWTTADWRALLSELRGASDAARCSELLLRAVAERIPVALAKPLRGVVLLRPAGEATGVYGFGLAAGEERPPGRGSLTAWRHVASALGPMLLELEGAQVRGLGGDLSEVGSPQDFASRDALMAREASHVLALPLRGPRGGLEGMLALEVRAPVGRSDGLLELLEPLALAVEFATPALLAAPPPQDAEVSPDPRLPVVGPEMQKVVRRVKAFARLDEPLLLRGETGVGKSQLATWVHARSKRAKGPMQKLNLHSVPDGLHESHLFGHVVGAFTGAKGPQKGLIELAEGGTLFIDEIDKLPIRAQASLLSVLDDGSYRAVGDPKERSADVRFLVGTNADLEALVEEGRFLGDLYYRITVLPARLPPLRERRGDIGPWADFMVRKIGQREGTEASLDERGRALLAGQSWPGNLRQLNSIVKRAFALARCEEIPATFVMEAHLREAMGLDRLQEPLLELLERGADRFVEEALARSETQHTLQLEEAKSFAGLVILRAVERLGRDEALRLLGLESYIGSNASKPIRKAERQRAVLIEALGFSEG